MIPFKNRFHGHGSLRYAYKNGKSVRGRLVSLKYTTNPKRKQPRFSVVVSKKVLKSAVGRNQIRRRLYEIIRQELPTLQANIDVVMLVFSAEVRTLPHDELREVVRTSLTEANLYKKPS